MSVKQFSKSWIHLFTVFVCIALSSVVEVRASLEKDTPMPEEVSVGAIITHQILVKSPWFSTPIISEINLPENSVLVGAPSVMRQSIGLGDSDYCITVKYRPIVAGEIRGGTFTVKISDHSPLLYELPEVIAVVDQNQLHTTVQFAGAINPEANKSSKAVFYLVLLLVGIVLVSAVVVISRYRNSSRQLALRKLVRLKKAYIAGVFCKSDLLVNLNDILVAFLSFYLGDTLSTMTNCELVVYLKDDVESIDFVQREELICLLQEIELAVYADLPVDGDRIISAIDEVLQFIRKCPQEVV